MSDEEINLPTEEELAKLPLRAIVVYAVRCARRVMPLYRLFDLVPHEDRVRHSRAVLTAISSADCRIDCLAAAHSAAEAMSVAFSVNSVTAAYAADAAYAAADAAYAAEDAASYYRETDAIHAVAKSAFTASVSAARAASAILEAQLPEKSGDFLDAHATIVNHSIADFNAIRRLDVKTIETAFDSSESGPLGPLWPNEPPDWYFPYLREFEALVAEEQSSGSGAIPEEVSEVTVPVFIVAWDPALVSEDEYAELVGSLGDLVRAHGGLGVRRLQEDTYGVIGAGVPV